MVEPADQPFWLAKDRFITDYDAKNVVNSEQASTALNPYESDPLVNQYCAFNFGERINSLGQPFPQFPIV